MQIQIDDALSNWMQMREVLLNPGDLTEATYSKLEMSANRYFELLKGAWQPAIRVVGEKALPTKSIVVPDWVVPELTQQQLTLRTQQHSLPPYPISTQSRCAHLASTMPTQ